MTTPPTVDDTKACEMAWIAPVYLRALMDRAQTCLEPSDDPAILNEALQYAQKALDGEIPAPEPASHAESLLPPGEFGRVELPGFVHYIGWVTDGTRAGCPVVVISDWDGRKVAEVVPQAMRQFIALPTPLKRPEPQTALPAGTGFGYGYAEMPDDSRDF
jgi:hypothetical protein